MQNRGMALTIAAAGIVLAACGSSTDSTPPVSKIVTFKAVMNAANEVPPNASTGTGTFTATLDTSTNVFTYVFTFTGLTTNTTLGHIHGPASTTQAIGALLNFATLPGATFNLGVTTGGGGGTVTLNAATSITGTVNGDSLKKLLFAGLTYANVHTTQNPGGEIRGQILKQ